MTSRPRCRPSRTSRPSSSSSSPISRPSRTRPQTYVSTARFSGPGTHLPARQRASRRPAGGRSRRRRARRGGIERVILGWVILGWVILGWVLLRRVVVGRVGLCGGCRRGGRLDLLHGCGVLCRVGLQRLLQRGRGQLLRQRLRHVLVVVHELQHLVHPDRHDRGGAERAVQLRRHPLRPYRHLHRGWHGAALRFRRRQVAEPLVVD